MRIIPEYPNYGVTRSGRVWSIRRRKFLKPQSNGRGYWYVSLGRQGREYIHRLVAKLYLGAPEEGLEVDHIDGDSSNNSLQNLRYLGRSENAGRKTEDFWGVVGHIRANPSVAGRELAKKHGISEAAVSRIRNNKSWTP